MQQTPFQLTETFQTEIIDHTNGVDVVALTATNEVEVLTFLARRPIHTVSLVSLIRDNGVVSKLNRGTFYGCYNRRGELEGIALVGHATLIETTSDRALEALALTAGSQPNGHMIMGESERMEEFWHYYNKGGQTLRRACREVLFELVATQRMGRELPSLRLATMDDLDLIAPVHARMAWEESGVDPLQQDPKGFQQRCKRRIKQGRTWVATESSELIFKADIVAMSSTVIYLEGIWTNEHRRSVGTGTLCISQLARTLLRRYQSLCVLVNENNMKAQRFYQRVGFARRSIYDTIFLL